MIRSVRRAVGAIVGTAVLDHERLVTLMCEVESIINNRPLTPVSNDPNDLKPITPNDLLLLGKTLTLPLLLLKNRMSTVAGGDMFST